MIRSWPAITLAASLLAGAGSAGLPAATQDSAGSSDRTIPEKTLKQALAIGKAFAHGSALFHPLNADSLAEDCRARMALQADPYDPRLARLRRVGARVIEQWPWRPSTTSYRFSVLKGELFNAAACPGGEILISGKALAVMDDDSVLAALLAHEIAHVEFRHTMARFARSRMVGDIYPLSLRLVAGLREKGQGRRPEAMPSGQILVDTLLAGIAFNTTFFQQERQADLAAMYYAWKSTGSTDAVVSLLASLTNEVPPDTQRASLYLSHAQVAARLASARSTVFSSLSSQPLPAMILGDGDSLSMHIDAQAMTSYQVVADSTRYRPSSWGRQRLVPYYPKHFATRDELVLFATREVPRGPWPGLDRLTFSDSHGSCECRELLTVARDALHVDVLYGCDPAHGFLDPPILRIVLGQRDPQTEHIMRGFREILERRRKEGR